MAYFTTSSRSEVFEVQLMAQAQWKGKFSQGKHDLLRARLTLCQILIPVTINLLQTTLEPLDRGRPELSVLDQTRDFLQERGEFSSVVVVQTKRFELETVCGEYNRNCEERWLIAGGPAM